MRTTRLTGFGFALLCLFLSNSSASGQAPAQSQPTQSRAEYCQASSSDGATIYFSDVFESNVPSNVIVSGGIENLFGTYLERSYRYKSSPVTPVVCALAQNPAASEQDKKQVQARYAMIGKPFVETHWKLSGQQPAALAALPTTHPCYEHDANDPNCQPAPKTLYEVCRALTSVQTAGKYTTYFTDVMPRANINDSDYSAAFAAFLAKNYGVQGVNPECASVPSPAEGQKLMEEGWKVNTYRFIAVHTGWTYSSASRPEPPAPAPAASSATPITSYTVCVASDAPIAYVSAAFAVTSMDNPAWTNGFTQFLAQNYSYKGRVGCNNMDAEHAPTFLKNRIAGLRANKKQVVETGWTYGSSATAPAGPTPARPYAPSPSSPPAAAAGAPNVTRAVCWADFDPHTKYYSAVFDGTRGDYNVWMPAFKKFLEQKYRYMGLVRCTKRPNQADAQKYWDEMVSTARSLPLGDGSKSKIIETGWQYQ